MKSKGRSFLEDSYDRDTRTRKNSNSFRKSQETFIEEVGLIPDKFGNPIGIGDFVQIKLADGKTLTEGEIIDVNRGNMLTVSYDDLETNESITVTNIKASTVSASRCRH